jgi:hypothetical protein
MATLVIFIFLLSFQASELTTCQATLEKERKDLRHGDKQSLIKAKKDNLNSNIITLTII